MNRREFLASVFSGFKLGPIKETMASFWNISKKLLVIGMLLFLVALLFSIDPGSINWSGIAEAFGYYIGRYWLFIVAGISILLGLSVIRRNLSFSARRIYDKILDITFTVAAAVLFVWVLYKEYTERNYWKILVYLVILMVGLIRWFRRKKIKST